MTILGRIWYNTNINRIKGGIGVFQVGELVVYGMNGVCRIAGTEKMKVGGAKAEYYILKPVYRESATVYVPKENEQLLAKMRRVLSAEEIDRVLGTVPEEKVAWIEDPNERRETYAGILASGDRCLIVRMLRTLYLRRQELRSAGKQLRSGDDQLLRDAERLLHDEFALVLHIPQQEVPEYIRRKIMADA